MNDSFDAALREARSRWMDEDGVEIVGQGEREGDPVICVFVSGSPERVRRRLPDRFRGFPVEIRVSGPISAQ